MEELLMRNRIRDILEEQIQGGCDDCYGSALSGGKKRRRSISSARADQYRSFFAKMRRKGYSASEIGSMWRNKKGKLPKKRGGARKKKSGSKSSANPLKESCALSLMKYNKFLTLPEARKLVKDYNLYDDITGCDEESIKNFQLPRSLKAKIDREKKVIAREIRKLGLNKEERATLKEAEKLKKKYPYLDISMEEEGVPLSTILSVTPKKKK